MTMSEPRADDQRHASKGWLKDAGVIADNAGFNPDCIPELARQLESLYGDDWQPIETAPKWEPVILLLPPSYTRQVAEGYYNSNTPAWWLSTGVQCQPIGWRPLPDPPKEVER